MAPPTDKSSQRYRGTQGIFYHQSKRAIAEEAFLWVARLRAKKIQPHLSPTDTVFEYGVGLGWNLAALRCGRRIGFDVGDFLGPAVRERGIDFIADASIQPSGSVDVVVCHHALEHAWHPGGMLEDIRRLLRPRGRLLLFVPYEKERRFRKFDPAEPNHHLHSWNVQTLGNLVQDAGFRVQTARLAPFGQERFAANLAARLKLGESGFLLLRWTANSLKREFEVRLTAEKSGC